MSGTNVSSGAQTFKGEETTKNTTTSLRSYDSMLHDKLAFLEIDDACRSQLAAFMPILEKNLADLFDGFYGHLMKWPHLKRIIGDTSAIPRLKEAQKQHWRLLFSGRFDGAYVEQVRRIGLAHERIGLEPGWYMGGYAYVLGKIVDTLPTGNKRKTHDRTAMLSAVMKAVFLDMDMTMTVYHDELQAKRQARFDESAIDFEAKVKAVVDSVSSATNRTEASANSLSATAEKTSQQLTAAASASEQASDNVRSVAVAAEELSKSINEISGQVARSNDIAARAVEQAEKSNGSIKGLANTGVRIGEIVKMISDVAEQTNLLALNATIEAARAGDAGKGFAVVASEVKSLANQTADATQDIASQISAMQSEITGSVEAIQQVGEIIGQLSDMAATIAAAVEQQGPATEEIARNVTEAAAGTNEVSQNVSVINQAAGDSGASAAQILEAAGELTSQSETLQREVDRFLDAMRQG